jgi:hypothetical protein
MPRAEQSSDQRSRNEAHTQRGAHLTKPSRAFPFRGDISEVGRCDGHVRPGDAGKDATHIKPRQIGRRGHHQVVDRCACERCQQYRTAPETIAQRTQDRREQKLHQRINGEQGAIVSADGGVGVGEAVEESRQDRHDEPEADRVQ